MKIGAFAGILLLTGCTSYAPQPIVLNPADTSLAIPVAQILEQRANEVTRPWLVPVTVDLSAPLSLDAIAALTVVNNPDLAAMRARSGVSGAQVFAAGLLPDPTFSMGTSTVLSGADTMLDIAGALGFDLNALRTQAVRRELAVAQDRQLRLDIAWAEWQAAGQAQIQAVRAIRLERIGALARQSRDSAHSLLERTSAAAARGDIAGDRLQAVRLAAASAGETLRVSESDLATAQSELRRLLGLPPDFPLALASPEPLAPRPSGAAMLALAQENRADLAALRAGYDVQEATVHQAVLEQFPNFGLTLNTQRDSAGNLLAGPALDISLPLWNRNRGTIAVQQATREALRKEYDARLFQTQADIAAASAGISLAVERRAEALAAIPRLEEFASATRRAATRGDLSLETAENAEQTLRDRQIQLAQAEQDAEVQLILLELLTGTPIGAWPQ